MNGDISINTEQKDSVAPLCPHCDSQIRTVWFRPMKGLLGKRYLYFCSVCRKVLGVTQRKGFWMG